MTTYNQEAVLEIIATGEMDANELLKSVDPKFEKRFNRLNKELSKLLDEVRQSFPDACYYSPNDSISLLLGDSHDSNQCNQHRLSAVDNSDLCGKLSGGDW